MKLTAVCPIYHLEQSLTINQNQTKDTEIMQQTSYMAALVMECGYGVFCWTASEHCFVLRITSFLKMTDILSKKRR